MRWCALAVAGGALLAVSGPWWRSAIDPGPLSAGHRRLQRDCAACHGSIGERPLGFVTTAPLAPAAAASRCLECHAAIAGESQAPLEAHGLPPDRLRSGDASTPRRGPASPIACASCHHEHRGVAASLSSTSDQHCQTCHARTVQSFAGDHPEFVDYPPSGAQRIAFDHASHVTRILESGAEARAALLIETPDGAPPTLHCTSCHRTEPRGRMMPISGFSPTCTGCHHHTQQLRTASGDGIVALRIPGLDVAALERAGLGVGVWPPDAAGPGWDGAIPPLMRLLLACDREVAQGLATLDAAAARNVFLFDLYDANRNDLQAARVVALAVKRLLLELTTEKHQALARRLTALGPDPGALPALAGELPIDQPRADLQELFGALAELQRRWFPALEEEQAHLGASLPVADGMPGRARAVEAPPPAAKPAAPVDLGDLLGDLTPPPSPAANDQAAAPAVDLDDLLGGTSEPPATPPPTRDPAQEQALHDARSRAAVAEQWSERLSGALGQAPRWSLRPLDFSLRYRPLGHADPFLRAWLELTASAPADAREARSLFEAWADRSRGPGQCTRCHTVESGSPPVGGFSIRWSAQRSETRSAGLTFFDHGVHLARMEGECVRCHREVAADPAASGAVAEAAGAPRRQFQPIDRATCVACHGRAEAPTECLSCHSYHLRR